MSAPLRHDEDLYRPSEIARRLKVAPSTVCRWHREGYGRQRIKLYGCGVGRGLRFTWAAVQDFLRRQADADRRERPPELASYPSQRVIDRAREDARAVLEAEGIYARIRRTQQQATTPTAPPS